MTWIYDFPAWLFMTSVVLGSGALAAVLLALTRTRIARNETITHNDVAGPVLTVIGTILAVMLSFMVAGVWQDYDNAGRDAQSEASALSDLHHLADAFPSAVRNVTQNAVDRYLHLVIDDEWPAMRHGGESKAAHDGAYRIALSVERWKARGQNEQALQERAFSYVSLFLDARRNRILANRQGIPMVLWATLIVAGIITVLFAFYFRVDRPRAQYIMVIAMTAVIVLTYTLIAELDYPFRGDVAIQPDSFLHELNTIHGIINGQ